MPNVDITVDADLRKLFNLPPCSDISIPGPKPLKVQLPTGGSISAFADISKGIPTDCSMTFSLLLQLAPFLAATECLLKVLKLLKPLIDIIQGLTKVPPSPPVKAVEEFVKAAVDLAPCLLVPTPASIIPFIRDLLCLILRVLNCFLGQIKSLLKVLETIESKLNLAQLAGNAELLASLQCAQDNANAHAQHLTASLEPIVVLLDLAGALFAIAGIKPIKLPSASGTDLQALNALVEAVQEVVVVITVVTDGLEGCGG
jgi:hypothetical protein